MNIKIFLNLFVYIIFSYSLFADAPKLDYGLSAYKKGNCMGCHKWHGDGGPGYGGAALSLRETGLDREQLITIVECGRPGTNMPFFDKKAYKDDRCFGMKFSDFEGDDKNRPLNAKSYLNKRQINAVVDFIVNDLQGKKVSKEYCIKFFGKPTRSCDGL
ncbi:MAG: cytochrome C [Pelagibacterales bacterium]|nr:cytochrome C [Pelagibacterales bacterium]OUU63534.1 MAG: hypothetical protein CBC22_00490 [Alphaproteobacteria bacterium TMED62]|tara:strand:- start:4517 stop:4993 length:477 start_codon:yes stop_codon:yes gene_type:complete